MFRLIWDTVTSGHFWTDLGRDFVSVLTQGHPPLYVQYLVITVIFLGYLLFMHDRRKLRNMPLRKWVFYPPGLYYFVALIIVTAGASKFIAFVLDPQTYVNALHTLQSRILY